MTAFTKEQIPAEIDTYEKAAAWIALVLNTVNPDLTTIEGPGTAVASAQFGIFKIDQTSKTNLFSRLSMELEDDFAYYDGPLWQRVKEFSTTAAPSELTA
ncbi:hypothetical protein NIES267_54980 [Calothrix parasitica NIES-267]|uniref:Uncharacterized protein n=1 Tax=Calothrix parasitica NIES-267 TaxID=1973488 RepID=A0A1Z4LXN6_9CYAN|nr:hypothetical protein NIES267_54980 [Calothrix parasitica NIES-267]